MFQYQLKSLFLGITVIAIWAVLFQVFYWQSQIVLAVIGLTLMWGDQRSRIAMLVVSLVVLLPFAWIFWLPLNYPWNNYRWMWVGMWPCTPGLIGSRLLLGTSPPDWVQLLTACLCTLATIGVGVWVGRIGKWWLIGIAVGLLAVCVVASLGTYAVFRA